MNGFSGASRAYTSRASYANGARQAFHKPRSSLGAAGRWVHLAAALSPLAISEFVEDAASRRKAIALVSVGSERNQTIPYKSNKLRWLRQ